LATLSAAVEKAVAQPEAALPGFHPPRRVGYWNPTFVDFRQKILHWDVTPFVTLPGQYEIWFQCGSGADALDVEWVVLAQGGKEVGRHVNRSVARGGAVPDQYVIAVEAPEPGKQYGLYAKVKSSGTASHGCVRMKYVGQESPGANEQKPPPPGPSAGTPPPPGASEEKP
jgi:hypothetical protein